MPAGWLLSSFQRLAGSFDAQFTNPADPDPLTNTKKAFCAPYAEAVLNTATYMSEYSDMYVAVLSTASAYGAQNAFLVLVSGSGSAGLVNWASKEPASRWKELSSQPAGI